MCPFWQICGVWVVRDYIAKDKGEKRYSLIYCQTEKYPQCVHYQDRIEKT